MKKMTDNEIICALECCHKGNLCRSDCPYDSEDDSCIECTSKLAKDTLVLINRQKAEIEGYKKNEKIIDEKCDLILEKVKKLNSEIEEAIVKAKSEAIKEFAERLKKVGTKVEGRKGFDGVFVMANNLQIDNLLKEMESD